jgi:transcription-repair coupling factor (superfamily II helicase)
MNLSGLVPLVDEVPAYRSLARTLLQAGSGQTVVVPGGAQPYLVAAWRRQLPVPVLVVLPSSEKAQRFYGQLLAWCDEQAEVILFPEPDALPYEDLAPDPFIEQQRLQSLARLAKLDSESAPGSPFPLIVASAGAVSRKTIPRAKFVSASHVLTRGMIVDPSELLAKWVNMGYERADPVEVPGSFGQRGGILDIYPTNAGLPARVELFGNQVDSIRLFDSRTQRSLEVVQAVEVAPARETADDGGTLLDYLPSDLLVIVVDPGGIWDALAELDAEAAQVRQAEIEGGGLVIDSPLPYLLHPELKARLEGAKRSLTLLRWHAEEGPPYSLGFGTAPSYGGQLERFIAATKDLLRQRRRVIIVSHQAARLAELLAEEGIFVTPVTCIEEAPSAGSLILVQGSLPEGWTMGKRTVLLTDAEVFGFVKQPRLRRPRPVQHRVLLPELSPGDYAVHVEHGIARFTGMTRLGVDGAEREYLCLQYAAGDRLYVPVDQADRVSRYVGSAGAPPALTRLGTHEWERVKRRVKESAREMARELLSLYAAREVVSGLAFSPDTPWQQELEASFPYIETPDQMEAVGRVKEDMEKAKPMDRLVCGDVGYGKTEVALRAAFKAVMDGKQVAMLVPTTVLAQQHFTTFQERLSAFPARVEMLSRFRSDREQQQILEGLKDGSVDICIGTHRLLQRDVQFRDLGLVIIDEEQRFGVAHKERLKQIRREVDVLTLSATPIPRTLHMSLVGVRDMCTMETPPEDRLPIKTYVSEHNEHLVREGIIRELERNGQVFFVHNRVNSIGRVARWLSELVPEAKLAVAHGQMSEEKLEGAMLDFTQGKVDVLVCTTIVESGLDIPNVNTLIINDADRLGLGQLYQLRGRVGRGNNRAYAYFLHGKGKRLTPAAEKRLQTIFEATELGAGFRIALKDLEIRGAGNLLGPQQSGHIAAVGFDLYTQLLAEAVKEAKAGQLGAEAAPLEVSAEPLPAVDVPLTAYIPEDYVADIAARLALYQRLAKTRSLEEVGQIGEELRDRFGELPQEAENLLYAVELRALASMAGLQSVAREGRQIVIAARDGRKLDGKRLKGLWQGVKVSSHQVRLDLTVLGSTWREALREVMNALSASSTISE